MLCEVPLTKEQQDFAAEHHGLVYKFLNDNHLPENEFYDVVIFPYLKAVQDYCNSASAQKYSFKEAVFLIGLLGYLTAHISQAEKEVLVYGEETALF